MRCLMTARILIASLLVGTLVGLRPTSAQSGPGPLRFAIQFSKEYSREPVTGRLILLLTDDLVGEPREKLRQWGSGGWVIRTMVTDWEPGTPLIVDDSMPGFPGRLSRLEPGRYAVQAIIDVNPTDHDFTHAHGNGRSRVKRVMLAPDSGELVRINIDTEIVRGKLRDLNRVRYRRIESRQVGRIVGHRSFVTAAVVLPLSYASNPERSYPVQYWFTDFDETARGAIGFFTKRGIYNPRFDVADKIDDFIYVLVSSHAKRGHHYWVDSANNGPWQRAFFEEVMPAIEDEFRIDAKPSSRFLVGHGAGGWSALWLLSSRAREFGGAWATAPDPVDFHDFYGVDLTTREPGNVFTTIEGAPRSLGTTPEGALIDFRTLARLEAVLGWGGPLHAFEAAFGSKGTNGEPNRLFNRRSGAIQPDVARHWRTFDIARRIARESRTIGPNISGKVNVYVGADDAFGLVDAARRLRDIMTRNEIRSRIEILEGLDHAVMTSRDIQERIQIEITRAVHRK